MDRLMAPLSRGRPGGLPVEGPMYWLKGCRKCGGDLYLEKDRFGSYASCMQCGAVRLGFDEARGPAAVAAALEAPAKGKQKQAA